MRKSLIPISIWLEDEVKGADMTRYQVLRRTGRYVLVSESVVLSGLNHMPTVINMILSVMHSAGIIKEQISIEFLTNDGHRINATRRNRS